MTPADHRFRNRLAIGLLIGGKVVGLIGLAIGSAHRVAGAVLLGIAAVLVVSAIVVSLRTMKARETEDSSDKERLREMMKDGTLQEHLRELEAELASDRKSPEP